MSHIDNYKKLFLDAVSFGNELCADGQVNVSDLENYINEQKTPEAINNYHEHLKELILRHFIKQGLNTPSHKCLEYSSQALQLLEDLQDKGLSPAAPIFLTVGNVRYKGEYVDSFNVNRNDIKQLISKGPDNSKITLHAWLTLFDLTVIDLTIEYSLHDQNVKADKPSILIHEHKCSDFEFEPLIVNNLFDRSICFGGLQQSWV